MRFVDEIIYGNLRGIYIIKNIKNKKVYVGQTREKFKKRFWHHQWLLNCGDHYNKILQNSWNKHGSDSFVFEVIHVLSNDEDLDDLERKYIVKYNSTYQQ